MKRAALGCAAAIALPVLAVVGFGVFGTKAWRVEATTTMRAAPEAVHAAFSDLGTWVSWSAWIRDANPRSLKVDVIPLEQFTFTGAPGVGMSAAWMSERDHACTLTITRSDPPRGVDYELVIDGFPSTARGSFELVSIDGGTRVTWTMDGERSDALGGFLALLTKPLLGKRLAEDLDRLRTQLEPPPPEEE